MNKILMLVKSLSGERGLPEETIFGVMETALADVAARRFDSIPVIRVSIDRQTGEYQTFRQWTIVADDDQAHELPEEQCLTRTEAHEQYGSHLEVGDVVEAEIESEAFGRIAAHQAKQIIMRLVREAERVKLAAAYQSHVGQLTQGQVKRVTRDAIFLELHDQIEAVIPRTGMLPREIVRIGDRVRAYILSVNAENKGPLVELSRTAPQMLAELFRAEVPEISEGIIEIKSVARDPGSRAKIAVKSKDGRIDPIGACVGMRGARVQAVSAELNGERVDIIEWDDRPAHLVIAAMSPAEVVSVSVDEEHKAMDVAVPEEGLSQAIGRNGQNVRLASQLSGWTLNVMTPEDMSSKQETQTADLKAIFTESLDIDAEVSEILVREGFVSLEHVAYVDEQELAGVEEFDEDIAEELISRAKTALLSQAMMSGGDGEEPADDLLALTGMPRHTAYELAKRGIVSCDDLAECAIDEIIDVAGMTEALAGQLIMTARAKWFEEEA